MSIDKIIEDQGITEVVHFTSNHGFVGCLDKKYLLSTKRVRAEDRLSYLFEQTAPVRFEESTYFNKDEDWIDYISMSISEINYHYYGYAANKWHAKKDLFWIILSFDSVIMTHDGVYFTTTNNSYDEFVIREQGPHGLSRLFSPNIQRMRAWSVRRGTREPRLTTCQQAEVLYPGALSLDFLRKVYVRDGGQADTVKSWLKHFDRSSIDVRVDEAKFSGCPN